MDRIIGTYTGNKKGPLLIVFGAMHGNEPAGVHAIKEVIESLYKEPNNNPAFEYYGKLIGVIGNLQAFEKKERYVLKDLNRCWIKNQIEEILKKDPSKLEGEEHEIKAIIELIRSEIADYQAEELIVLDLHTTTAKGGIFGIPTEDPSSIQLASELHAPVIRGLLKGLKGTTLHYFNSENLGIKTRAVTFESGQHQEALSVNRAVAAIINLMRSTGCVKKEDVENRHDEILIKHSSGLPRISELIYRHEILEEDEFIMKPGFKNFMPVQKGDHVADDNKGPILAPMDGLMLMPLYQKQGEDGYFLVRSLDN